MAQQGNPFDQFDAPANAGPQVLIPESGVVTEGREVELNNSRLSGQRTQQGIGLDAEAAARARAAEDRQRTELVAKLYAQGLRIGPSGQPEPIPGWVDPTKGKPPVSQDQVKATSDLANDEILAAIQRARQGINAGWSTGRVARWPEVLRPQAAFDLKGDLGTIASRVTLDTLAKLKELSATGASGLGALSEREGDMLRDSVSALDQGQSAEKLMDGLANVEKHYRAVKAIQDGKDYRDPAVARAYGIAEMPKGGAGAQQTFAQGASRDENDPALAGVNNRVRSMIGAGKSGPEISAYMNSVQPGLGDKMADAVTAAARFRAQNPTVPLSQYPVSVEARSIPMSPLRQTVNQLAQSPLGTYAMSAGDAVTAGTLDNLTSNPALARAGMATASQNNPISSVAGLLTGGGLAAMAGEGAVGGLGKLAPLAGDALYGAAYGAGSADEGDRASGALMGAGVGLGGGIAGRAAMRGAGSALRGIRDEGVQRLNAAGIPMTLGQMTSQSGGLGRFLKGREDRLAGFNGIGDKINAQRTEGIRGFNRATFNEGIDPIANTLPAGRGPVNIGEQGVADMRGMVSGNGGAYDQALDGVSLTPEPQFAEAAGAALAEGSSIPRVGPEFAGFIDKRIAPLFNSPDGTINGRQMQDAIQGLRGADFGTDSMGLLGSDAARSMEGAITDMAGRQAPQVMPAFGAANTAYRNLNIIADAVGRGANTDGLFTPAQLGMAARGNTTKFGGKIAAATPDRPFFDLQRAAQNILPSKVPDSGTAGRAASDGGVIGAIKATGRNVLNAPLYSEALQPTIQRGLLNRSDAAIRAGDVLQRRARIGGIFGAPMLLQNGPFAVTEGY